MSAVYENGQALSFESVQGPVLDLLSSCVALKGGGGSNLKFISFLHVDYLWGTSLHLLKETM